MTEMDDAIDDSDEEADYSKMDLVSFKVEFFLRYLAARNFMLSGTALLRGMTYSCCEELGTFKPSFHHQH